MTEEPKKNHWYEMYELECLKTKELKKCLKDIVYMVENGLHTKNELAFSRCIARAKEQTNEQES